MRSMKYSQGDVEKRTVMLPSVPLHEQFLWERHKEQTDIER